MISNKSIGKNEIKDPRGNYFAQKWARIRFAVFEFLKYLAIEYMDIGSDENIFKKGPLKK